MKRKGKVRGEIETDEEILIGAQEAHWLLDRTNVSSGETLHLLANGLNNFSTWCSKLSDRSSQPETLRIEQINSNNEKRNCAPVNFYPS